MAAERHKLLDLLGGMECVNIGYGRSELGPVAAEAMAELGYWSSLIGATIPAIERSTKLAEIAPGDLNMSSW